jgi:hypothetical protein
MVDKKTRLLPVWQRSRARTPTNRYVQHTTPFPATTLTYHQTSASKPKGKSQGDITVKQGGMSNTDTKHSTEIKSSEKSTKGDGNPETAKSKGTIDPNAPVK